MIKVNVTKQSSYPIPSALIKKRLSEFLTKEGIVSDAEVSVAIIGEAKMLALSKDFLKEKPAKLHNVLSFTSDEVKDKFIYPPDGIIHLGEIAVCYPEAFRQAVEENKKIDEKVLGLIEHGALHLLGVHHE